VQTGDKTLGARGLKKCRIEAIGRDWKTNTVVMKEVIAAAEIENKQSAWAFLHSTR
jgi:hypothetical protein